MDIPFSLISIKIYIYFKFLIKSNEIIYIIKYILHNIYWFKF